MNNVSFLTSGKIDYQLPGYSLYESIALTASGKVFPSLAEDGVADVSRLASALPSFTKIFTAPSAQAKETAELIARVKQAPVIVDGRLLPLRFTLSDLMSETEFNSLGDDAFTVLRRRFLEAFFEDRLLDSHDVFRKKYTTFLNEAGNDGEIFAISHAFLIKLFEVYSLIGEEMFTDKEKLFKIFNPAESPYGRLAVIRIDNSKNLPSE